MQVDPPPVSVLCVCFFFLGSRLFGTLVATIRRSYVPDTVVRVARRFEPAQLAVQQTTRDCGGASEERSAAFSVAMGAQYATSAGLLRNSSGHGHSRATPIIPSRFRFSFFVFSTRTFYYRHLFWLGCVRGGKTIWCVISERPHGTGRCPFSLLSHGLSRCPRSEGNAPPQPLPVHAYVLCVCVCLSLGPISFPSCNPSTRGRL